MNNDRIKNWAHLAEIVSSVAVIFSLIFIIFEIRENSDLIRANMFDRSIESLIDWRMQIVSDDESLKIMADHWGIDDRQLLKHQLLVVSMWSIYEKTYYSHQYDLIGPAEWERFETRICAYGQAGQDFWAEKIATFLSEEFRNFVISSCQLAE
jgi:hypothetical protein